MKRFKIVLLVLWFPISMTYAQSYQFQGFWETKKGKSHEIGVLGVKASEFQKAFDLHTKEGLDLAMVDGCDVKGKAYINAIFRTRTGNAWMSRSSVSGSTYQRLYNRYVTDRGFHLTWLDSYRSGNSIKYAFIFTKKGKKRQKAYHAANRVQHQQRFDQWTADGWRPINVSVVSINGKRYYTAFYEKRKGSYALKSFLTRNDFETAHASYKKQGKKIAYMNAYTHDQNTLPRFVAIWRGDLGDGSYLPNVYGPSMMDRADELGKKGYFTRFVTGYGVGEGHRFDAIWYKPQSNIANGGTLKMKYP